MSKGPPLDLRRRGMSLVYEPDTPVADMLEEITGGDSCASFHGQSGGEWDTLRETPLKVRRSLTSAGFFSLRGWQPDRFVDILVERGGGAVRGDPMEWYVRTARTALRERREAHRVGAEVALAKAGGHDTIFAHRDALAVEAGYCSYWKYRRHMGWD
jgi:hypothetical protein